MSLSFSIKNNKLVLKGGAFNYDSEDIADIYRSEKLPKKFSKLPFIRVGYHTYEDSPDYEHGINHFKACLEGKRCISELDTPGQIVVKAEVPLFVLSQPGYTYRDFVWKIFLWKTHDVTKVDYPDARQPCEAIPMATAGIDKQYLYSISSDDITWEEYLFECRQVRQAISNAILCNQLGL